MRGTTAPSPLLPLQHPRETELLQFWMGHEDIGDGAAERI